MAQNVVDTIEVSSQLKKLGRAVTGDQLDRALLFGGSVIERETKKNIRKQGLIDVGNLRASIRAQRDRPGVVIVGTNVIYAAIHEFGGVITAKNKPMLVFKINGQWIRKRSVTIPARPYLRPAFDSHKNKAVDKVGDVLKAQIRTAAI